MAAKEKNRPVAPDQLKNHYGLKGIGGKGVTVGVVTAFIYDELQDDLDIFRERFGLPFSTIEIYESKANTHGKTRWQLEAALCTQWVHAFAPDAKIKCFVSGSADLDDIFSVCEKAGKECDIVSLSFGVKEFGEIQKYESVFESSPAFFVCSSGNNSLVNYPACSRFCLGVGGSNIDFYADSTQETAYDKSGCGVSRYIKIPDCQLDSTVGVRLLSAYRRAVPDITFFAGSKNGVATIFHGKETSCFGTSIGAPCIAGFCACIAQNDKSILTKKASFFYELAEKCGYNTERCAFFDITKGGSGKHSAHKGFDLCTGLGSPNMGAILKDCHILS